MWGRVGGEKKSEREGGPRFRSCRADRCLEYTLSWTSEGQKGRSVHCSQVTNYQSGPELLQLLLLLVVLLLPLLHADITTAVPGATMPVFVARKAKFS